MHAIDMLGRAAPAHQRKPKALQAARHLLAQHAQAHDADGKVVDRARKTRTPKSGLHVGSQRIQHAVMAQHSVAHILHHQRAHARVFEPHHRHACGQTQLEQCVHTRPQVENGLHAGIGV